MNKTDSQVDSQAPSVEYSVIIPVLNDASSLDQCLQHLFKSEPVSVEIIVVDGGSLDDTLFRLREKYPTVSLIESSAGRGTQMNAGAQQAKGRTLLFLHSDCILPYNWQANIRDHLEPNDTILTAFSLLFGSSDTKFKVLELLVSFRSRFFKLPYGDQGFAIHRDDFLDLGGFHDEKLFEDVEFIGRARKKGKIRTLAQGITTSTRNWRQDGFYRRLTINVKSLLNYKRGVAPEKIRSAYKGQKRAVLVFAKKPEPGKVKTRLAQGLGKSAAAAYYSNMVERIMRALLRRTRSFTVILMFTPRDQYQFFLNWLGSRCSYVPQSEGGLGEKLQNGVIVAQKMGYTHMALIGTDCPDLEPRHLETAFIYLHSVDVVIGPAHDGGYYLIAFKADCPDLFSDIDWSTERVLAQTLEKISQANLTFRTLETLRDVDTVQDLKHVRSV